MRNWWLVLCLAGLATAIGLALGAALALAGGPCDGLSGNARARCECRVYCAPWEGTLLGRTCMCTPPLPRGLDCRTGADCLGRGGQCVGGTCCYPDGGAW